MNFNTAYPVAQVNVAPILPQEMITTLGDKIKSYNENSPKKLGYFSGQLAIESIMPTFFETVISQIITHLAILFAQTKDIQLLFLVGGFAESELLQSRIKAEFADQRVVIPNLPGIAVVNGAVLYGLSPKTIKARIMPTTIGIKSGSPWEESKHKGRTQRIDDKGRRYCSECISCFVKVGDKVPIDHMITHSFQPNSKNDREVCISLYGSPNQNMEFVTDAGAQRIGFTNIPVPDVGSPIASRSILITMRFGGTTVEVSATYEKTGESIGSIKSDFNLGMNST